MDRFAVCQAYAQLESDYNVDGCLRERPSNQRRRESVGCQLARMRFSNPYGWVDIEGPYAPDTDDPMDEDVREVYLRAVLRLGLPIPPEMMAKLRDFFVPDFLAHYPQCAKDSYLQE